VVAKVLEMLEDCGAVEACVAEAKQLVEEGWQRLSPLVDDSITKVMLRGFGWYVLERHY
jgi:geranylgeranyl pyrophosphate synthase